MSTVDVASTPIKMQSERAATALSLGLVTTYLGLIVALPIAALMFESPNAGWEGFWDVGHEPGVRRRAEAHARDFDRRRADQRRPRHDHGLGARP